MVVSLWINPARIIPLSCFLPSDVTATGFPRGHSACLNGHTSRPAACGSLAQFAPACSCGIRVPVKPTPAGLSATRSPLEASGQLGVGGGRASHWEGRAGRAAICFHPPPNHRRLLPRLGGASGWREPPLGLSVSNQATPNWGRILFLKRGDLVPLFPECCLLMGPSPPPGQQSPPALQKPPFFPSTGTVEKDFLVAQTGRAGAGARRLLSALFPCGSSSKPGAFCAKRKV